MRARFAAVAYTIAALAPLHAHAQFTTGWRPIGRSGTSANAATTTVAAPTTTDVRWYHDNTSAAFKAAVAARRPLIVFLGGDGQYAAQMIRDVLPSEQFGRLAGAAVFAYADPQTDAGARFMVDELKVERLPTMLLIAPNGDTLEEVARVVGYYSAPEIVDFLGKYMAQRGWIAGPPPAASLGIPRCNCAKR